MIAHSSYFGVINEHSEVGINNEILYYSLCPPPPIHLTALKATVPQVK